MNVLAMIKKMVLMLTLATCFSKTVIADRADLAAVVGVPVGAYLFTQARHECHVLASRIRRLKLDKELMDPTEYKRQFRILRKKYDDAKKRFNIVVGVMAGGAVAYLLYKTVK